LPDGSVFYEEFVSEYNKQRVIIEDQKELFKNWIFELKKILEEKRNKM
jgi:hypothetical protein